jgi:hypothetical protein
MLQAEMDALDAIGFQWYPPPVERRRDLSSFWKKIEEMKEFKQKHGHLNISYGGVTSTTETCLHERKRYKAIPIRHRKNAIMIPEEIGALNSIGFDRTRANMKHCILSGIGGTKEIQDEAWSH